MFSPEASTAVRRISAVLSFIFGCACWSCGGSPAAPSNATPLPFVSEGASALLSRARRSEPARHAAATPHSLRDDQRIRAIPDQVMSYRIAGSFVLFLQERFGLSQVLSFLRVSRREDSLGTIGTRFEQIFGVTLEQVEADWLAMLQRPDSTVGPRPGPRKSCYTLCLRIVDGSRRLTAPHLEWAASSVGRAPRSQRGGREFEPPAVHQIL